MGLTPDALYSCLRADLATLVGEDDVRFLESNPIYPDARPFEAACSSLLRSFLKKYEIQNSQAQDRAAALKFMEINDRCKLWSLQLANSREEALYGEFKRAVYNFFTINGQDLDIDYRAALDEGRCGPGSSIMALGGDSYTKLFASPISCTNRTLYTWYRRYISNLPEWHNAEGSKCSVYTKCIECD
jgi:hypothetical protein